MNYTLKERRLIEIEKEMEYNRKEAEWNNAKEELAIEDLN